MWPEHAPEADGGDRDADPPPDVTGGDLDLGERPAELAGRSDRRRLVGAGRRAAGPAVDLDAAADDDRLQRPALGGCAERRDRRLRGQRLGRLRVGSAERLPHRHVHDDVRIEPLDKGQNAIVIVRRGEVELGPLEPSPWRVGVDPEQLADPCLTLEVHGDARPKSPPIPLTRTRRPGRAVILVPVEPPPPRPTLPDGGAGGSDRRPVSAAWWR